MNRDEVVLNRDEVVRRLKQTEPKLKSIGVEGLYHFGSFARDEAKPDSDIDVFVKPASENDFGFDAFMEAYKCLQETFPGKEIGYGTHTSIGEIIRPPVNADATRIF